MGALEDAREAATLPTGVRPGASTEIHRIAKLLSVDPVSQRATVSIDGSQPVALPYSPGVYTGYATALVLCNPLEGGRAVWVLSPVGNPDVPIPTPPAPPAAVTATATILPTWSGTWRTVRSAWDRWNVDRPEYGGRATLYQGSDYGSGSLTGLAVYGDQITGLGALSIVSATVNLVRATGSGTPTVQGATNGTPYPAGGPSVTGDTAAGVGAVPLPVSTCEGLRTGAIRGLALVGGTYAAVFGRSRADGMALQITYTRAG